MADDYGAYGDNVSAPPTKSYAIVPSDVAELPLVTKSGIFVGTGGSVKLRPVNASADVTYKNLGDGSYISGRFSHVRATGTTAADLIAEA